MFCSEIGEEPAVVALAWLLKDLIAAAPIIGPQTVEKVEKSLHTLEADLSEAMMIRLAEILWPGLVGAAPEAYAW